MIFDNDKVTTLAIIWQQTRDPQMLERIILGSTSLVEAIVAGYGYTHKDDLLQESFSRIIYALPHFNPRISSLHNYLTTVIRNTCSTFLSKENKQPNNDVELNINIFLEPLEDDSKIGNGILSELIARNRLRFPNLGVSIIDSATKLIYDAVRYGIVGKSRGIIVALMNECCIKRPIATIIYHSTLAYLRSKYYSNAKEPDPESQEFSLLTDLREAIGAENYSRILLVFSGMYIKIP